jgi:hypothetical protein
MLRNEQTQVTLKQDTKLRQIRKENSKRLCVWLQIRIRGSGAQWLHDWALTNREQYQRPITSTSAWAESASHAILVFCTQWGRSTVEPGYMDAPSPALRRREKQSIGNAEERESWHPPPSPAAVGVRVGENRVRVSTGDVFIYVHNILGIAGLQLLMGHYCANPGPRWCPAGEKLPPPRPVNISGPRPVSPAGEI